MKTKTVIESEIMSLQLGFFDPNTEDYTPITIENIKELAERLACSPALLDVLMMLSADISEKLHDDLKMIWARLDAQERVIQQLLPRASNVV